MRMGLGYSKFEIELTEDFIRSIRNNEDDEEVLQVMRHHPFVVNALTSSGELALCVALEAGNSHLVREILKCDSFRPEIKSELDGSTYIMRACQCTLHPALAVEIVSVILAKKPKLLKEVCSENGWTALHYCAAHDVADMAEFLLSFDRDLVATTDHMGQSALHVASVRGSYAVCKLLLSGYYCIYTSDTEESAQSYSSQNRDKEFNRAEDLATTLDIEALFRAHKSSMDKP